MFAPDFGIAEDPATGGAPGPPGGAPVRPARSWGPVRPPPHPRGGRGEDPATGGASGPLGGYLVRHELSVGRVRPIRNLQGVRMGRPSWIFIEPVVASGQVTAVRVGGAAVVVGTGTIDLR